jgi:hypothetical protein
MFFRELEYMSVSMDGVLTLLGVTLLCFYYSLIVALVSVPVLSKFLSVCIWWVLLPRYFPVVHLGASKQMGIENLHSISRYCHLTDFLGGVMYVCMDVCMYACMYFGYFGLLHVCGFLLLV